MTAEPAEPVERYWRHDWCTCGHTYNMHEAWYYSGRRERRDSGCASCDCKAFVHDPAGCSEAKKLTPKEQRGELTDAGREYLNTVTAAQFDADMVAAGLEPMYFARRLHYQIEQRRPIVNVGEVKRGKNIGRKSWGMLLEFLRRRGFLLELRPPTTVEELERVIYAELNRHEPADFAQNVDSPMEAKAHRIAVAVAAALKVS